MAKPEDVTTDDPLLREVLGMSVQESPAILAEGQVIDGVYRIESELGAGGMGRVYLGRDLRLGRSLAIKLHTTVAAESSARLEREAAALARFAHPNVVTVYAVGTWGGHPWVAMEYVPGGTARDWLAAKPRTRPEIIALYLDAAKGLAAAHEVGLVHRDFKPDNVLVGGDGRARVADFGLAREIGDAVAPVVGSATSEITHTGTVMGTPAYMAPEQWAGGSVGAAADQYAFAIALWEALAGDRPFPPFDDTVMRGDPRDPPAGKIPAHVERALRRALAFEPADRWPTLAALVDELRLDPQRTRRRRAIAGGLALVVAGTVVAVWLAWPRTAECAIADDAFPTESEVALVVAQARTAKLDGEAYARRVGRVIEELRVPVAACSDAARACREHAVRTSRALIVAARELPASEILPVLLEHPVLAACDDPARLAGWRAPPELEAARILAERGDLAVARAIVERSPGSLSRDVARAAIAVRAGEPSARPLLVELAARARSDGDGGAILDVARLAITFESTLRLDRAATHRAVDDALEQVERLRVAYPDAAYRTQAAAAIALATLDPLRTLAVHSALAGFAGTLPPWRDAAGVAVIDALHALSRSKPAVDEATALAGRVQQVFGERHLATARAQLALAFALYQIGKLDDSAKIRAAALATLDAGTDGSIAGAELDAETGAYFITNEPAAEGEPYLQRARAAFVATFGEHHVAVGSVDVQLATLHLRRGEYAEVITTMTRAIADASPLVDASNHLIVDAMFKIALAQRKLGHLDDALATLHRIVPLLAPTPIEGYAPTVIQIAEIHNLRGDHGKAIDVLKPLVDRLKIIHSMDGVGQLAWALSEVGRAHLGLGHIPVAIYWLEQAKLTYIGNAERIAEVDALLARARAKKR
ncbi:MAG: protein kinase [Kofleriaceae bacterium]